MPIFFHHIFAIDIFQISQDNFFLKNPFKPNLWLFSKIFGPFLDFYYLLWWSMYKIWVLRLILIYRNPFWKIYFENVLKGPFQPLCIQRALIPQTSNWSGTRFCRFLQQTGSKCIIYIFFDLFVFLVTEGSKWCPFLLFSICKGTSNMKLH